MARHRNMSHCYNVSRTISLGWCYKNRRLFMRLHFWNRFIGFLLTSGYGTSWSWWLTKPRSRKRRTISTSCYLIELPLHQCHWGLHQEHYCVQSSPGRIMVIGLSVLRRPLFGMSYLLILIFPTISIFSKSDWKHFYLTVPIIDCSEAGSDHPCLCIFGLYDM